jgi:hypothetical protein
LQDGAARRRTNSDARSIRLDAMKGPAHPDYSQDCKDTMCS